MIAPVVPLPNSLRPTSLFDIELATSSDDSELRGLLRRSPIPSSISVTFEREPSLFDSCRVRGDFFQVGIGRDRRTGSIIGLGTRSISSAFVNGRPTPLGYLADLRLDPQYRGGTLIARGYRFLRQLHEDQRTRLYTTIIFSENLAALTTIACGRAGLPKYHDMGIVHSPGINIRRAKPPISAGCEILRGSEDLLPEIVECLNRNNARRQFAPVHAVDMFKSQWRGFDVADFYLAVRGRRVIGVLGCWDQSSFKQTRVVGYGRRLRWLVPIANALRPVTGTPRFPRPGQEVSYFYISFVAVDGDDLQIFRALLRHAYNDAVGGQHLYAILALHERDAFFPALREYSLTPFSGRLFCVAFADGENVFQSLDQRVPYLEAATF
ncbi:MAG TPA: hypothetical protein VFE61_20140 [Candidatus Sulfotelmatobacter sp.]|nr:hypothetical protein [Candidatus Sulfotelmatobacter sp.]